LVSATEKCRRSDKDSRQRRRATAVVAEVDRSTESATSLADKPELDHHLLQTNGIASRRIARKDTKRKPTKRSIPTTETATRDPVPASPVRAG
jgi:hypothetical protein